MTDLPCSFSPWLWTHWEERPYSSMCPAWVLALQVIVSLLNEKMKGWKKQWMELYGYQAGVSGESMKAFFCLFFWLFHFRLLKSFFFPLKWIYCYCILQQVRFGMLLHVLWWLWDLKIEHLEFQRPRRHSLTATLDCFPFITHWLWKSQVILKPNFPKSGSESLKHS